MFLSRDVAFQSESTIVWPKWLSVRLRTKWFWVRDQLQLLKYDRAMLVLILLKVSKIELEQRSFESCLTLFLLPG